MTSFLQTFDEQRRGATSLYWCYGSNLSVRQMARRCPGARKIKALPVYGAKLVFRGVADVLITNNPEDVALGGLWRITAENERALDRYEGVQGRKGMYTKEYFYLRDKSRHYHAVLYYKMNSEGIFPPSEGYLAGIVDGYTDFGLDLTKLDEAVRRAWDDKHKTEDMRQRWLRTRPALASGLEQALARRQMITASRPQPRRAIEPKPDTTNHRIVPANPRAHWPRWPSVGPNSKLLPKPQAEQGALFPNEQRLNPSAQESAEARKQENAEVKDECCRAFALGEPMCNNCPAKSLDEAQAPLPLDDALPHGED